MFYITIKSSFARDNCKMGYLHNCTDSRYRLRRTRSNTVFDGVNFDIKNEYTRDEFINQGLENSAYRGFFSVSKANRVTIKNASIAARRYYRINGTYSISANSSCYVKYENCIQSNYYKEDGTISVDNLPGTSYDEFWGIGGSSYCKNIEWDGCMLTRYDAHAGLYNGIIRNSTVTRVYLIGGGTMLIENTEITCEGSIVTLREDYGATWNGDIILRNVTVSRSPSKKNLKEIYMLSTKWENHDFGYTCHLPNYEIDNLILADGFNPKISFISAINSEDFASEVNYAHLPTLSDGSVNLNPYQPPDYIKVTGNSRGYTFYIKQLDIFADTEISGFVIN